jgi:hypothetical protein
MAHALDHKGAALEEYNGEDQVSRWSRWRICEDYDIDYYGMIVS